MNEPSSDTRHLTNAVVEIVRKCERQISAEIEVAADHVMGRHGVAFARLSIVHFTVTPIDGPLMRRGLAVDGGIVFETGYHRAAGSEYVWHLVSTWLSKDLRP